jgi:hypothetical protein
MTTKSYIILSAWTCSTGVYFFSRLIFTDKSTFHISGKVNEYNMCMWGTENPREMVEHVQDSLKVNVFCAVFHKRCMGHSFFMRTQWLEEFTSTCLVSGCCLNYKKTANFIFIQDEALPHLYMWFEITWMKICLDVGLATQQTRIWHWHVGHQQVRI